MRIRSLLAFAVLAFAACHHESDLPKLFPVPSTSLVNEEGKTLNLDSLKGNVVVYNFIFTNCTGVCPIMTNNMRAVTKKIDKDAPVRFVSISVDPAHDTPRVLADYAMRFRNDPRWMFLTADRSTIVKLSVNGFKLAAGDPQPGGEPLLHSAKFAIADKTGVIREYADGSTAEVAEHVQRTVNDLLRE
ncbi:MAG TPA: SCO family protein [Thermoanaerobaculia bacterium]|nr:SCO family protein [Thermoanaerobaculia bacterium]